MNNTLVNRFVLMRFTWYGKTIIDGTFFLFREKVMSALPTSAKSEVKGNKPNPS